MKETIEITESDLEACFLTWAKEEDNEDEKLNKEYSIKCAKYLFNKLKKLKEKEA